MKKALVFALVVLTLMSIASSAFALVPASTATAKQSPVYINRLTVTDPYLTSLTVSNWGASMAGNTYAANTQIFFLAEIIVAGQKDTDGPLKWDGNALKTASLEFTSPNNAVNFSAANMAFFAQVNGFNVNSQSVTKNSQITSTKAAFELNTDSKNDLQGLYMAPATAAAQTYYLHFAAITNAATEGVCKGTLSAGAGNDSMKYNRFYPLYDGNNTLVYNVAKVKNAEGGPWGGKGNIYVVAAPDNSGNVISFVVSGKYEGLAKYRSATNWMTPQAPAATPAPTVTPAPTAAPEPTPAAPAAPAPEAPVGSPTDSAATPTTAPEPTATPTPAPTATPAPSEPSEPMAFEAKNYEAVYTNYTSASASKLVFADGITEAISTADLQRVFDFFGFSFQNNGVPEDRHFIGRGSFISSAEAKFNAGSVLPPVGTLPAYPPMPVPQTDGAPESTGYILAACALLLAGAAGFVFSRRASRQK